MDVLAGISLVAAIVLAVLYFANGKKAEMAMDVARELRKRLDEAEKKTASDKPCTEVVNPSPTVSESQEVEELKARLSEAEAALQLKESQLVSASKDMNTEVSDLRRALTQQMSALEREKEKSERQNEYVNSLLEQIGRLRAELEDKSLDEKQKIQEQIESLETELNEIGLRVVKKQEEYEQWESRIEEKERKLIADYQEKGREIIETAKAEAKDIVDSAMEAHLSYQDYTKYLSDKGLKLRSGYDLWKLERISDDQERDKETLKDNTKKQKELLKAGFINAVNWDSKDKEHTDKCNACWKKVVFSSPKARLAVMGINYLETIMEDAKYNYVKWGLQSSLDYLMDVKANVENLMRMAWYQPKFSDEYMALKIEEVELRYNIEYRKQQAREELKAKKEAEREEAKAQKEFEREIKRAQKDKEEARKALERAELEAAKEKENKERFAKLQEQIEKLKSALKEAEERGQRILSMAQQTRRGWVYIISNIGSFGEGVYKIGLTRRLDPMERVYELGDASVPFPFDVHAFIFSEDAPALETALHQAFDKYKVNSVNWRKEYFKVSLDAIKKKVSELGYEVDWEDYAYAPQFRDSSLRK